MTIAELLQERALVPVKKITPPPAISEDLWAEDVQATLSAAKKPARSSFISRRQLKERLLAMQPTQVLFPSHRRSGEETGSYRGYAVEVALRGLIGVETFCQATHVTRRCQVVANPRWFKQLYTDLAWAPGDITPAMILSALA